MPRSNQNQNRWKRKKQRTQLSVTEQHHGGGEFDVVKEENKHYYHYDHPHPHNNYSGPNSYPIDHHSKYPNTNSTPTATTTTISVVSSPTTSSINEKLFATLIYTTQQWAPVVIVPIIFDYAKSLWDTKTAICIRSFRGSQVAISALLSLADGRLVSGSDSLRIWNITEKEVLTPTKILDPSHSFCLAYLSEQKMASSSLYGIKIWDLKSETCVETIKDRMIVGPLVSFSRNNNQPLPKKNHSNKQPNSSFLNTTIENELIAFATAISDKDYIKIWNVKEHRCIHQLREHSDLVRVLASLPNGYLVSGSRDKKIKIWDLERGGGDATTCGSGSGSTSAAVQTLEGHTAGIRALLAISDDKLISASSDTSIKIWDLRSGTCITHLQGHEKSVSVLGCLDDGYLISGSSDKTAKIWDLNKNEIVKELKTPAAVESLTVLGDGRLVLGLTNSKITLWEGR